VDYEAGTWKVQWRKESSNVREAENNLTDCVERLSKESQLFEHEVFVLTDNSAFEGAYYKGHSPSEKLNDIVFRLQGRAGWRIHTTRSSHCREENEGHWGGRPLERRSDRGHASWCPLV